MTAVCESGAAQKALCHSTNRGPSRVLPDHPVEQALALVMDLEPLEAQSLLERLGGTPGLASRTFAEMQLGLGFSDALASRLVALREVALRLARHEMSEGSLLNRPAVVSQYLRLRYARFHQEVLGVLYLSAKHRLIAEEELFVGTRERITVDPVPVLRKALLLASPCFIVFHNHPGGDPTPSAEDLLFTRRLNDAAELVGVRLQDHLVLGSNGAYVSLRDSCWKRAGFSSRFSVTP